MWEALEFMKTSYINEASKYPYRGYKKKCRQWGDMIEPEKEKKRFLMDKFDNLLHRDKQDKNLTVFIRVNDWYMI